MQDAPPYRLLRVVAGGALLALLAAEGRACPQLLVRPAKRADGRSAAAPVAQDQNAADKKHRQQSEPVSLAELFPDAVPARQSRGIDADASGELAGRRASAVASAIAGQVPVVPSDAVRPPDLAPAWRNLLQSADRLPSTGRWRQDHVQDPAVSTILRRTGPPCI